MKTEISLVKTEANKLNAKLSTGPKTTRGKTAIKWNAMKHGLLAKEVVIRTGDGKESKSEFQMLMSSLIDDLQPEGALEEMLVEKIVVCYWRLRRVVRCEAGEIHQALDNYVFNQEIKQADSVNNILDLKSLNKQGCEKQLIMSIMGIQKLQQILYSLQSDIEEYGEFCEQTLKEMIKIFGSKEETFGHDLFYLNWLSSEKRQKNTESAIENEETPTSPDTCRKLILDLLDGKQNIYKNAIEVIKETQEYEIKSHIAKNSIPSCELSERILRYETAIERQMYRAMNQLERLQRQRRGEITALPINIDISEHN